MNWDAETFAGPRAFARHMLKDDRLLLRPHVGDVAIAPAPGGWAIECVLFREACWQVELVVLTPGVVAPRHRHNRVDSCDLLLAGRPSAITVGDVIRAPAAQRGSLAANLIRIGKGVWHSGEPSNGAVYLSFQKWDGEPGVIGDDWEQE